MTHPTLAPGDRFGAYEVVELVGAGGMGEVYRARDMRLSRDVALKILPDQRRFDPQRRARFEREAQLLSSLNHPNIATLHGLEESDGATALVMELVEGETLADLIARRERSAPGSGGRRGVPLAVRGALEIARQIADALESAHERGIIHRDLKPANIKVRPDGTVKVLDFGLAKVAADDVPGDTAAATLTVSRTVGVVVGTAAYMSPEQARGLAVDRRTDVWAFGCVLYEMLTGRRAFAGDTTADALANVLNTDPDFTALPPQVPSSIRSLVRRCLAKEARERLRDIGDARIEIAEATQVQNDGTRDLEPGDSAVARDVLRKAQRIARLAWAAIAIVVAGSVVVSLLPNPDGPSAEPLYALLPTSTEIGQFAGASPLALSPDGRRLVFVAAGADGIRRLRMRRLDQAGADDAISGTEGAVAPFWSADGRQVAFVANRRLMRVDITRGGPPVPIANNVSEVLTFTGAWNRDDVVLFRAAGSGYLSQVPAGGGSISAVTTLKADDGEVTHGSPTFLPDGRRFLYRSESASGLARVYVASLDSAEPTLLLEGVSNVQYAHGALFFIRGGTVLAQPFDARRARTTGDAVAIDSGIQLSSLIDSAGTLREGAFSVSESGRLVYLKERAPSASQLTVVDRSGLPVGTIGGPGDYGDVFVSHDGKHVAVSVDTSGTGARDIHMFDVEQGLRTLVTFEPGNEFDGIWSPDDSEIIFNASRGTALDLFRKPVQGGEATLLWHDDRLKYPQSWSRDGKWLLYITAGAAPGGGQDMWALSLVDKGAEPFPLAYNTTQFDEGVGATFSPDGKWIAYTSTKSGSQEVYVAPFPGPGESIPVSRGGGLITSWSEDGRELYYYQRATSQVWVATVTYGRGNLSVAPPQPLFPVRPTGPRRTYDVIGNGRRFVVNSTLARPGQTDLRLIENWPALLAR